MLMILLLHSSLSVKYLYRGKDMGICLVLEGVRSILRCSNLSRFANSYGIISNSPGQSL